jgi:hypothetical protein
VVDSGLLQSGSFLVIISFLRHRAFFKEIRGPGFQFKDLGSE